MDQWLEHQTRPRRVVGSNPIWGSDFSESTYLLEFTEYIIIIIASGKNEIKIEQNHRKPSKTDQLTKLSSCCHAQFYAAS